MSRIPFVLSLAAAIGLLAGSSAADDPKPCIKTTFEVDAVKNACAKGGQAEAKKVMNAAVKKAKAAGQDVNCKSCHETLAPDFKNKPNAVADLKKWL